MTDSSKLADNIVLRFIKAYGMPALFALGGAGGAWLLEVDRRVDNWSGATVANKFAIELIDQKVNERTQNRYDTDDAAQDRRRVDALEARLQRAIDRLDRLIEKNVQ